MSSKYIDNNAYAFSGYTLSGVFQSITIGSSGSIGAYGLVGNNDDYTIVNRGRVTGFGAGIALGEENNGSSITNAGTNALIQGGDGIFLANGSNETVFNSGTIDAYGARGAGIVLPSSFLITNSGTIKGVYGLTSSSFNSNHGTIDNLSGGLIDGKSFAVSISTLTCSIFNAGTILGEVDATGFCTLTNSGSAAFIEGTSAVAGCELVTNSGTIIATGSKAIGVDCSTVTNSGTIIATGSTGIGIFCTDLDNSGIIEGYRGVVVQDGTVARGHATLANYGTIASILGTAGTAVQIGSYNDALIDEAGSSFVGRVTGDGARLILAGTAGTLTGLGASFTGFHAVEVITGAAWTLGEATTIASGTILTVEDGGTLDSSGVVVDNYFMDIDGVGTISGSIGGTGHLELNGTVMLDSGAGLISVANLFVGGGATTLGTDLAYAGHFMDTGGSVLLGGQSLGLSGAAAFAGGAIDGAGFLLTHGRDTLSSLRLGGGAKWRNYGTVIATGELTLGSAKGGTGLLNVEAGGIFDIGGKGGIAVAAGGTGTLVNAGVLEKTAGTGDSALGLPVGNIGTIKVTAGTLELAGAVSGAGLDVIGKSGTLKFDGEVSANQRIDFTTTADGDLVLNDPVGRGLGFAGSVHGFGGKDELDFETVSFTSIGWKQEGDKGVLSIRQGPNTARIILFGQYLASGFHGHGDDHGGTVITYTRLAPSAELAAPQR